MNSNSSKARPYSNPDKGKGKSIDALAAKAAGEKSSGGGMEGGDGSKESQAPVVRELIESFAVALILALLFRAFVAEAFVIPTGSMAPTLMGAHKDVRCPECQFDYQCGASSEFDELQKKTGIAVTQTVCPLCRFQMAIDPQANANHATFAGDKILVSRFAYFWHQPRRWDVFVFKNPSQARQNYIKRLVGVPKEKLEIRHGDVYVQPLGEDSQSFSIARKPPRIVEATLQPVYDSAHRSSKLTEAGLPSAFQSFPPGASVGWKVEQTAKDWRAGVDATASERPVWLRYFHQVVDGRVWKQVVKTSQLPVAWGAYQPRLITDFTHYNAGTMENGRATVSRSSVTEDPCIENDGWNWVSDLAMEYEVEVQSSTGTLYLDCVESGVHHVCTIDIATGKGTLTQRKGERELEAFVKGDGRVGRLEGLTSVRGAGRYRLKMANVDDQLLVWVNGRVQEFDESGAFDTASLLGTGEDYPHWSEEDPMDGAPLAIGVQGGKVQVTRAKVWRDIYYIATYGRNLTDYDNFYDVVPRSLFGDAAVEKYLARVQPERKVDRFLSDEERFALWRDTVYSSPEMWAQSPMFSTRRSVFFQLEDRQYFPMGDNSLQSFDARAWSVPHVPEPLILGRAILVLWPHSWNAPIPWTPNVPRMGLIR